MATKTPLEILTTKFDSLEKKIEESVLRIGNQVDNMLEHLLKSIEEATEAQLSRSIQMNSGKPSKVTSAQSSGGVQFEGKCSACKQKFKFEASFHKYHYEHKHGNCKKLLKETPPVRKQAKFVKL